MSKLQTINELFLEDIRSASQLTNQLPDDGVRDVAALPLILQHFLRDCGVKEDESISKATIKWKDTMLRFSPDSGWENMSCTQVNFLNIPVRLVYMKLKFWKLFLVEAYDRFIHNQGNMLVKLFKYINITDAWGKEMDEAELVTILAETIIIPSYALQKYVSWTVIEEFTLKGVINFNGMSVSGFFYFNGRNEILRFETYDRYYTLKGGGYQKMKWTATAENYIQSEGRKFPSYFKASWNTEEGEFEYFRGSIDSIEFNQRAPH
ncbi:DUF6920 family protein [Pedobacter immunditicola]|uniref:DUF6920 family protein n=1 Tax=Pedobacter immunditicola TaxID=3133440 RepID=UPI0030AC273B